MSYFLSVKLALAWLSSVCSPVHPPEDVDTPSIVFPRAKGPGPFVTRRGAMGTVGGIEGALSPPSSVLPAGIY